MDLMPNHQCAFTDFERFVYIACRRDSCGSFIDWHKLSIAYRLLVSFKSFTAAKVASALLIAFVLQPLQHKNTA
jgi:hypothetical protein